MQYHIHARESVKWGKISMQKWKCIKKNVKRVGGSWLWCNCFCSFLFFLLKMYYQDGIALHKSLRISRLCVKTENRLEWDHVWFISHFSVDDETSNWMMCIAVSTPLFLALFSCILVAKDCLIFVISLWWWCLRL